jgi:hypothetical protein
MWLALFASKVSHQQKFMALRRLWFDRQGSQRRTLRCSSSHASFFWLGTKLNKANIHKSFC